MPTNWKTPVAADLAKVISLEVIKSQNENIGSDVQAGQPYDPDADDRVTELLQLAIDTFRGNVQVGSRFPVSATTNSVPPEAVRHILNWAAWELVLSTPSLKFVIVTDQKVFSPFGAKYKAACDYFDKIAAGGNFVAPTDPAGQDYLTDVSTTNPPVGSIFSAGIVGEVDLSTSGQGGGRRTSGTASPEGSVAGDIGDSYVQEDAFGMVVKVWEKVYGVTSTTGWR